MIAVAVVAALHVLQVTAIDARQQQQLVWRLAEGDLARSMGAVGRLRQTSGPGYGYFAVPLYLPLRLGLDPVAAFRVVGLLTLVPLGVAALALSRVLGVPARSLRELLDVAAVVVGVPVLACLTEYFHPADVLATAALLGAVAALGRGRVAASFVLLGFAVATRQWAVVAVAVLIVLVPRRERVRLGVGSAGVAVLLTAPFLLAAPHDTAAALTASGVLRGRLMAAGLLPLDGAALYLASRILPLVLVGAWCAWLWRHRAAFAPELAVGALAVALLVRPLVDPAGFLYYLAPGYAFAVLLGPRSWRWPVAGLVLGAGLWYRRSLRVRWPALTFDASGYHPHLYGGALSVLTTLVVLLVLVAAADRTVALLTAAGPSGAEVAAGGPGDPERGDGVFG